MFLVFRDTPDARTVHSDQIRSVLLTVCVSPWGCICRWWAWLSRDGYDTDAHCSTSRRSGTYLHGRGPPLSSAVCDTHSRAFLTSRSTTAQFLVPCNVTENELTPFFCCGILDPKLNPGLQSLILDPKLNPGLQSLISDPKLNPVWDLNSVKFEFRFVFRMKVNNPHSFEVLKREKKWLKS